MITKPTETQAVEVNDTMTLHKIYNVISMAVTRVAYNCSNYFVSNDPVTAENKDKSKFPRYASDVSLKSLSIEESVAYQEYEMDRTRHLYDEAELTGTTFENEEQL